MLFRFVEDDSVDIMESYQFAHEYGHSLAQRFFPLFFLFFFYSYILKVD